MKLLPGVVVVLLAVAPCLPATATGRASHGYSTRSYSHSSQRSSGYHASRHSTPAGTRSADGRIERSETAREKFMRETGYPHGRPGYVIDHVIPLARGGADDPSNMQCQTKADGKAKDKWELGPRHGRHGGRRN